ncbi:ABC transporter permease [Cellulosimicrobium terreum]|nr:ABC transporter permease [Cellulosimicrobium terreum]
MSTTALPTAARRTTGTLDRSSLRLTMPRAIRAELLKLTSSRSTWFTGVAAVAVMTGISAMTSGSGGGTSTLTVALAGSTFVAVLLGAFGAVAGAREFGTGLARTSLAAVPRRRTLVGAKVIALLVVVIPFAALGVVGAAVVGGGVTAGGGAAVALTDLATLEILAAYVAYLAGTAVIGLAIGLLLRSSAGAVATTIGAFLVLPMVASLALPAGWADLGHYLPSTAGAAMTSIGQTADGLSPAVGGTVFLAWVVVAVGSAVVALSRRDA